MIEGWTKATHFAIVPLLQMWAHLKMCIFLTNHKNCEWAKMYIAWPTNTNTSPWSIFSSRNPQGLLSAFSILLRHAVPTLPSSLWFQEVASVFNKIKIMHCELVCYLSPSSSNAPCGHTTTHLSLFLPSALDRLTTLLLSLRSKSFLGSPAICWGPSGICCWPSASLLVNTAHGWHLQVPASSQLPLYAIDIQVDLCAPELCPTIQSHISVCLDASLTYLKLNMSKTKHFISPLKPSFHMLSICSVVQVLDRLEAWTYFFPPLVPVFCFFLYKNMVPSVLTMKTLDHALIISHLHYCNVFTTLLWGLLIVYSSGAQTINFSPHSDHMTLLLESLY